MQLNNSILIMIHCEQHTGYAIGKLEVIFMKSALAGGYDKRNIFFSFTKVREPSENIYELRYNDDVSALLVKDIIITHRIDTIVAFDLPYPSKIAKAAKQAGVGNLISYWGASMSGLNSGIKLTLKKIEWLFRGKSAPDFFIFESKAMQLTAIKGRGVPESKTTVIPLGVDIDEYKPVISKGYVHKQLNIPSDRKIIFYSGHMEERKGIRTIVKAARHLSETGRIAVVHFVLCGNKGNEADTYIEEIKDSPAINHVTFAGYREDIPLLMQNSDLGVIASTGWDSFTMSSIEMLASGIPLIASNLGGLAETTVHGQTGYLVPPGDYINLAESLYSLLANDSLLRQYSSNARARAQHYFQIQDQIIRISKFL
ncbi:MAG TPA: glycosyltransferase family 1 protein [Gammaproteobacteria bacterium]|nr:glycosyltransferase family 1 protein [Gammaproteobacteria bacterium]